MATILFAWELGGGLGHVGRMVPIARELAALGHTPIFTVRNVRESRRLFADAGYPVLQAPYWHPHTWTQAQPFVARSYADVLARHGYTDEADLLPMVKAWDGLIDLIQPRLIVADHSPTLCVAARGRIPMILVGEGFTTPPTEGACFPDLMPSASPVVAQERIAEVIRAVQVSRGMQPFDSLPELLATAARFVTIFRELDPYRVVRTEPLAGPLEDWSAPTPPPVEPRVLAYLSGQYPNVGRILAAFVQAGVACSGYFRDASQGHVDRIRAQGIEVFDTPPPLLQTLPRFAAIVHHGGVTTTSHAFVTARPQLLLPCHLEQELTARAVVEQGVGAVLAGSLTFQEAGQALRSMMEDASLRQRAMTLATNLHQGGGRGCLREVVAMCHALISKARAG